MYGYARVSIREPEDKNLDLQVERLVRAGCSMGNIRAEEASGAKDDRGGLLELLDLVVEGDTLVVTHIDRLSRGLTYGLQVIEGLTLGGGTTRQISSGSGSTATRNARTCSTVVRLAASLPKVPLMGVFLKPSQYIHPLKGALIESRHLRTPLLFRRSST